MTMPMGIPREYGYVVLVIVVYMFLNTWMAFQVGKAREKYKVYYPTMYASRLENKYARLFNCVQRGHQNSVEQMPIYFTLMMLGGINHPFISSILGILYVVSRYFYFTGYSTGVPRNRLSLGKYGFVAYGGLLICTISSGISLLLNNK